MCYFQYISEIILAKYQVIKTELTNYWKPNLVDIWVSKQILRAKRSAFRRYIRWNVYFSKKKKRLHTDFRYSILIIRARHISICSVYCQCNNSQINNNFAYNYIYDGILGGSYRHHCILYGNVGCTYINVIFYIQD